MAEGYDSMMQLLALQGVPANAGNVSRAMAMPQPQVVPIAPPIMPGTPIAQPQARPQQRIPMPPPMPPGAPQAAQGQDIPMPPPIPPHMLQQGGEAPLPAGYEDTLIPGQAPAAAASADPAQGGASGFFDQLYEMITGVPAAVYGAAALAGGVGAANAMRRGAPSAGQAAAASRNVPGGGASAPNMPQTAASATNPPNPANAYTRAENAQNAQRPAFGKKVVPRAAQSIDELGGPIPYGTNAQAQVDDFIMSGGIPRQGDAWSRSAPQGSMPGGMPQGPGPQVSNVRMGGVAPAQPPMTVQPFATGDTWAPLPDIALPTPRLPQISNPGASIQGGQAAMPSVSGGVPTVPAGGAVSQRGVGALADEIMAQSPQPKPKPKAEPKAKKDDKGGMSPAEAARRKSEQRGR
jgi:hypothetical protein